MGKKTGSLLTQATLSWGFNKGQFKHWRKIYRILDAVSFFSTNVAQNFWAAFPKDEILFKVLKVICMQMHTRDTIFLLSVGPASKGMSLSNH